MKLCNTLALPSLPSSHKTYLYASSPFLLLFAARRYALARLGDAAQAASCVRPFSSGAYRRAFGEMVASEKDDDCAAVWPWT
jgi:hypothetical protein